MKSLGVILVGKETIYLTGYLQTTQGIQCTLSKKYSFTHSVNVEVLINTMLDGDFVAKGEWKILLIETLFPKTDELSNLFQELQQIFGTSIIKLVTPTEVYRNLCDWYAFQSFSPSIVVI